MAPAALGTNRVQGAGTELDTWGGLMGFAQVRDLRHLFGFKTMDIVEEAQEQ